MDNNSTSQDNKRKASTYSTTLYMTNIAHNNAQKSRLEDIEKRALYHGEISKEDFKELIGYLDTKTNEIICNKINILIALKAKGILSKEEIDIIIKCLISIETLTALEEKGILSKEESTLSKEEMDTIKDLISKKGNKRTILNKDAKKIIDEKIKKNKENKKDLEKLKNNTINNTAEYSTFKSIWNNGQIDRNTEIETGKTTSWSSNRAWSFRYYRNNDT